MNTTTKKVRPAKKLNTWIAPKRTALLVIDLQVDFASPAGALGKAGADLSAVPAALAKAASLADGARAAGAMVIFIRLETRGETDSPAWVERTRRLGGTPEKDLAICRAGTPGAEFCGPLLAPGDIVIVKSRYSSFVGTNLDSILKAKGIDTLVMCGLTTECCVDCTVRDAFHRDYHVFLAADACASCDKTLHEAAVQSLERNCAIVVRTDDVVKAWTG
ncbi:MAG TPA: isochorismatase family cysteine hydrolase [Rhizomicrobium sp.]|jgi:ureidoacrylate peracid hydrolase